MQNGHKQDKGMTVCCKEKRHTEKQSDGGERKEVGTGFKYCVCVCLEGRVVCCIYLMPTACL